MRGFGVSLLRRLMCLARSPRKRASEHFVNVPRDFNRFTAPDCPLATECLLTAIAADLQVLRTSSDPVTRLEALKFLGHWVGDLHQPLHVSFADDRGGNRIREIGPCQNNLHSVWDGCIIEREFGTQPREVAHDLLEEVTDTDRTTWVAIPIEEWANESLADYPPRQRGVLCPGRDEVRLRGSQRATRHHVAVHR